MESRLNPDAKEFVPSPTRTKPAFDDAIISQSPTGKVLTFDNVEVPTMAQFQQEISQRPGEVSQEDALSNSGYSPNTHSGDILNGGNIIDDDMITKKYGDTALQLTEQNLAAFTSNNPFEVSEVSSTKAVYGDESVASFMTSTSDTLQKNLGTSASNVEGSFMETDFVASETLGGGGFEGSSEFTEFKKGLDKSLPTEFSPSKESGTISFELQNDIAPTMEESPERVKLADDFNPFSHEQPIAEMPMEESDHLQEDEQTKLLIESFEHGPNFTLDEYELNSHLDPCAPSFDYKNLDVKDEPKAGKTNENSGAVEQKLTDISLDVASGVPVSEKISPESPKELFDVVQRDLTELDRDALSSETEKALLPEVGSKLEEISSFDKEEGYPDKSSSNEKPEKEQMLQYSDEMLNFDQSPEFIEKLASVEKSVTSEDKIQEKETDTMVEKEFIDELHETSSEIMNEFASKPTELGKSSDSKCEILQSSNLGPMEEQLQEDTVETLEQQLRKDAVEPQEEQLGKDAVEPQEEQVRKDAVEPQEEQVRKDAVETLEEQVRKDAFETLEEQVRKDAFETLEEQVRKDAFETLEEQVRKDAFETLEEQVQKDAFETLEEQVRKDAFETLEEQVRKDAFEPLEEQVRKDAFEPLEEQVRKDAFEPLEEQVRKDAFEPLEEQVRKDAFEPLEEQVRKDAFEPPEEQVRKDAFELPEEQVRKDAVETPEEQVRKDAVEPTDIMDELHGAANDEIHVNVSRDVKAEYLEKSADLTDVNDIQVQPFIGDGVQSPDLNHEIHTEQSKVLENKAPFETSIPAEASKNQEAASLAEQIMNDTDLPHLHDIPEALRVCVYPMPVVQNKMKDDVELISPSLESHEDTKEPLEKEHDHGANFDMAVKLDSLSGEQRDMVETVVCEVSNKTELEELNDLRSNVGNGVVISEELQSRLNYVGNEAESVEKTDETVGKTVEKEGISSVEQTVEKLEVTETNLNSGETMKLSDVKTISGMTVENGESDKEVSKTGDGEDIPMITKTPPPTPTPASQVEVIASEVKSESPSAAAATAAAAAAVAVAGVTAAAAGTTTKKEPASKKLTPLNKDVKKTTPVAKDADKMKPGTKAPVKQTPGAAKVPTKTSPTSPTKPSVPSTPRTSTPKRPQVASSSPATKTMTKPTTTATKPLSRPTSAVTSKPTSLATQKQSTTGKAPTSTTAPKPGVKSTLSSTTRPSPPVRAASAPKPRVQSATTTTATKTLANGDVKSAEVKKTSVATSKIAPRSHTAPSRTTTVSKTTGTTAAASVPKTGVPARTSLTSRTGMTNGIAQKPKVTSSTAPSTRPATNHQTATDKQHKETANKQISSRRIGSAPSKTSPAKVGVKKSPQTAKGGKAPPTTNGSPLITGTGDEKKKDPLL